MGQRQNMSRQSRSGRLRKQGRVFESLESREMLDGGGFDAVASSRGAYRVGVDEFLSGADLSNVNPAFFEAGPELVFTPAIVGGSAGGSPADSPSNAVDPNTAGGQFGGVASIKILIPDYPDPTPTDPENTKTQEFLCTGSVLSPTYVLTAAHCFDELDANGDLGPNGISAGDGVVDPGTTAVVQLNDGDPSGNGVFSSTHVVSSIILHDSFAGFGTNLNDDIALLELSTPVPVGTPMYAISETNLPNPASPSLETPQRINMVGYGLTGSGDTGLITNSNDPDFPSPEVKRQRQNMVDFLGPNDETIFIPGFGDAPLGNELFVFDFDGPTTDGFLGGATLGNDVEGNIAPGDSGGPSFLMEADGTLSTDSDGKLIIGGINTFNGAFGFGQDPGHFVVEIAPPSGLSGGNMLGPYAVWIQSIISPPPPSPVDIQLSSDVTVGAGSAPGLTKVTYELTATNAGPNDATGVVIDDTLDLPAGVTISDTTSAGSYGTTWNLGDLDALDSETLTLEIEFDPTSFAATDAFDIAFSLDAVIESDTDGSNDDVMDSPSFDVALAASISGGDTWAIDAVPLNIGANGTLSWVNMKEFSVSYAGPLAVPPPVQVYGPTNGVAPITATLLPGFDGVTAEYSVPVLTQGYYKIVAAGEEIDFSIKPGDANNSTNVNILDFSLMLGSYQPGIFQGTTPNPVDFNGTGSVDIFDFSILLSFYNTNLSDFTTPTIPGPPPPPPAADFAAAAVLDSVWASAYDDADDDEDARRRDSRFA